MAGPIWGRPGFRALWQRIVMKNTPFDENDLRLFVLVKKIENSHKAVEELKSINDEIVNRDRFKEDVEYNVKMLAALFGMLVAMIERAFRGYHEGSIL